MTVLKYAAIALVILAWLAILAAGNIVTATGADRGDQVAEKVVQIQDKSEF